MSAARARIIGDPNKNSVELPARRGRKGILVAKTCLGCKQLRMAADFGLTGHSRSPDPRCKQCHAEAQRGRDWRRYADRTRRDDHRRQATTVPSATRYGQQWTGVELEIALRSDLTSVEAALMLGRTKYAVETMRRRHKQEPLLQRVAGASDGA